MTDYEGLGKQIARATMRAQLVTLAKDVAAYKNAGRTLKLGRLTIIWRKR